MENNELITVIVPIYNVEKYLEECINSIINQTYHNLEILLINDGSTDDSKKICDKYVLEDNRIKIIDKINGGLSDARNLGLDIANGRYIQFIDSDDYIEKDMIETLYNLIKKYDVDIAISNHYVLKDNKITSNYDGKVTKFNNIDALKELLLDNKIRSYSWEKLWKKELFDEVRFPFGKRFEDIATTPILFGKARSILLYDYPKYYYRQRKGSIMNNQSDTLRLEYIEATLNLNNYINENFQELNIYSSYNIVHAMVNTYNDIALFNMNELYGKKEVKELYEKAKNIMSNKDVEQLIVEKSSNIKKLHLYYILSDVDGYIKNHKQLPLIYAEHG